MTTFAELIARHNPKYYHFDEDDIDTDEGTIVTKQSIADDTEIKFITTDTLPAPLVAGTSYYAINADTEDDFVIQVTDEESGSAIEITDTGEGDHHYYFV
jgi:hypothetical protein